MEYDRKLLDLGFPRNTNKSHKKARKVLPAKPPTNTTLDKLQNKF